MQTAQQVDFGELKELNEKKRVATWAGCSTRQIELLVRGGKFPAPIRLGTHPRWRKTDLLEWMAAQ